MEKVTRRHIPVFGEWNNYDEMPITQYFESAMQAGLIRGHYYQAGGQVLFKASQPPHKPTNYKVKKAGMEKQCKEKPGTRQGRSVPDAGAHAPRKARVARAVDEDLYKIPPDMLYEKPRRKKITRSLWMGCVGLDCVA